jgi:hypothetical protein
MCHKIHLGLLSGGFGFLTDKPVSFVEMVSDLVRPADHEGPGTFLSTSYAVIEVLWKFGEHVSLKTVPLVRRKLAVGALVQLIGLASLSLFVIAASPFVSASHVPNDVAKYLRHSW